MAYKDMTGIVFNKLTVIRRMESGDIRAAQLSMRIGYNRAVCLLEAMEADGIITAMNNRGERKLVKNSAPQK